MNRILMLLLLLVSAMNVAEAQEEYAYKKMTSRKGNTMHAESPVATASTLSKMETRYKHGEDIQFCEGDQITGITFRGYNLGEEKTRHLTIWAKRDYEMGVITKFSSTDEMTKVFEGDCTILHGGTADHPEDILDIPFSTPVTSGHFSFNILMTIGSEGEASDSVFFLHAQGVSAFSLCTIAGEDGQWCEPFRSDQPFATFTVATPVRYVSGTVTDEDGKGFAGATIELEGMEWYDGTSCDGITDGEGKYLVRIADGNKTYAVSVSAPGHTSYNDISGFSVKDNPTKDYTLYGSVSFKANQQSTIILPVTPDSTAGRYYRLVRREGKRFIFEREPAPKANVPYVFFAHEDYRVDLSGMDLSISPGRINIDSLSIVGAYDNGPRPVSDYIIRRLDVSSTSGDAMHAYLYGHYSLLLSDDFKLVFTEPDTDGIRMAEAVESSAGLYDLQGRRLSQKPERGVYIRDGRKVVIK